MNSFDEIVLRNEKATVGINAEGGYVTSWRVLDSQNVWKDILYTGSQLKRSGIPILFPYFGKAAKWPQHGFGRDCKWKVIEKQELLTTMELRSEDLSDETHEWYPYNFVTRIGVAIGATGDLLYSLEVNNLGKEAMPISPGLHPYWAIPHADKKNIRADGIVGFDATIIDWDQSPPDNRYDFSKEVVIHFADRKIVIRDVSDIPVIKHLVVWSQTPLRDPDYDFVCIEPIVGHNYSIDHEPVLVQPGKMWQMCLQFSAF